MTGIQQINTDFYLFDNQRHFYRQICVNHIYLRHLRAFETASVIPLFHYSVIIKTGCMRWLILPLR